MKFKVIDKTTGEPPDLDAILKEDWASWLLDLYGFAIIDDGSLLAINACGNYRPCPLDRFEIVEVKE